ncbi:hypothetical protein B0T22DRAFT_461330 [Podospora appendiculata]|uniref:DUF7587 domain-containing protein n=1 Tax=Podospora appendiculata TaxID=314037 RepID=A0AAE1CD92_9PEZI|nr:hypothetical protein B0T22DRAFT_461330 [Podospora appendiculata]
MTIYTRAYSNSSAGKLVCGRKKTGGHLSPEQLLEEFKNHALLRNQYPTALVSVSDRLLDTLNRAFNMKYERRDDPANIWVVFINVPDPLPVSPACTIHSAEDLARKCGIWNPQRFHYEFLFEWAIPEQYAQHKVSLKTLVDRGLDWDRYYCFRVDTNLPLRDLREKVREMLDHKSWPSSYDYYGVGISLGWFAKSFGARAPLKWICFQLLQDCIPEVLEADDEEGQDLCDGIDDVVADSWLASLEFFWNVRDWEEMCEREFDRHLDALNELKAEWEALEVHSLFDSFCDGSDSAPVSVEERAMLDGVAAEDYRRDPDGFDSITAMLEEMGLHANRGREDPEHTEIRQREKPSITWQRWYDDEWAEYQSKIKRLETWINKTIEAEAVRIGL